MQRAAFAPRVCHVSSLLFPRRACATRAPRVSHEFPPSSPEFKPTGPWFSPKWVCAARALRAVDALMRTGPSFLCRCDNNFSPPKCSEDYHMQEQTLVCEDLFSLLLRFLPRNLINPNPFQARVPAW